MQLTPPFSQTGNSISEARGLLKAYPNGPAKPAYPNSSCRLLLSCLPRLLMGSTLGLIPTVFCLHRFRLMCRLMFACFSGASTLASCVLWPSSHHDLGLDNLWSVICKCWLIQCWESSFLGGEGSTSVPSSAQTEIATREQDLGNFLVSLGPKAWLELRSLVSLSIPTSSHCLSK